MEENKAPKCFEYLCPKFPICENAVGSCCAVDDFFGDASLPKEDCFDRPDKPLFKEKPSRFYKPGS